MATYNIIRKWYHENIELVQRVFSDKFIKYDKSTYTWVFIKDFNLPKGWRPSYSNLLIRMPGLDSGFETAPYGFYVDKRLRTTSGRTPEHYFESDGVNDLEDKNYAYLSIHIKTWNPRRDVISGDNLLTVIDIIYQRMNRFAK